MTHLFLDSVIGISIESLYHGVRLLCRLLDNCHFLGLFVNLRLESEFFLLFLLTLDPEFLQLFVLLLLQLVNSLVNRVTVFKFL